VGGVVFARLTSPAKPGPLALAPLEAALPPCPAPASSSAGSDAEQPAVAQSVAAVSTAKVVFIMKVSWASFVVVVVRTRISGAGSSTGGRCRSRPSRCRRAGPSWLRDCRRC
jgi:hypothetical protein